MSPTRKGIAAALDSKRTTPAVIVSALLAFFATGTGAMILNRILPDYGADLKGIREELVKHSKMQAAQVRNLDSIRSAMWRKCGMRFTNWVDMAETENTEDGL